MTDESSFYKAAELRKDVENGSIRLLQASTFAKLSSERRVKTLNRQGLEKRHPEAFASEGEVERCLQEMEVAAQYEYCGYPGVVAISYPWMKPEHPDPEGSLMAMLAVYLHWYAAQRAKYTRQRLYRPYGLDEQAFNWDFVVFIDYWSLYQRFRTPQQQEMYERALSRMHLVFGHRGTLVFQLKTVPQTWDGDVVFRQRGGYSERGWPMFEQSVSLLGKSAGCCLDFSQFEAMFEADGSKEVGWDARKAIEEDRRKEKRWKFTGLFEGKEESQLASLALYDGSSSDEKGGIVSSGSCLQQLATLLPPMAPREVERVLRGKQFGEEGDVGGCVRGYDAAAKSILGSVQRLEFVGARQWGIAQWQSLAGALSLCNGLRVLVLDDCAVGDEEMQALAGGLEQTSLPKVEEIMVWKNGVKEGGWLALAEAVGRGVAPRLRAVWGVEREYLRTDSEDRLSSVAGTDVKYRNKTLVFEEREKEEEERRRRSREEAESREREQVEEGEQEGEEGGHEGGKAVAKKKSKTTGSNGKGGKKKAQAGVETESEIKGVQASAVINLLKRYAMPGTDIAYGAPSPCYH